MTRGDGPAGRRYRFGPRDTTGWFLGLNAAQCISLAVGILTGGVTLTHRMPVPVVVIPVIVSAGVAFGRWDGQPVHERLPTVLVWWTVRRTRGDRWHAPITPTGTGGGGAGRLVLPVPLDGLELVDAHTRTGEACGVLVDRRDRTATVVLRAQASRFSLCDPGEQDRLVGLWGEVLAGFCTERSMIGRLRWTEFAAPGGFGDELAYLDEHTVHASPATDAYRDLVTRARPASSCHDVLLAITIEARRLSRSATSTAARGPVDVAVGAGELVAQRLERAELGPAPLLGAGELGAVLRSRLDPFGLRHPAALGASLAALAGLVPASNAGPMAVQVAWDHVRVDRAFHAGYVIHEWPRLEVPARWMEPLLLHAGGIRTIAMHYEPVPPSRSQRRIDREAVKLTADEEHRARSGFRIGARQHRAQSEVSAREDELVAGYAELEYVGFVIVTAPSLDELRDACEDYEQVALGCGLELRRLDGRHDLALACALPVGRGVAPRRFL